MEIDRQVAIRLQEIELAQQHQQEPKPSRPDDRFATVRSSTQTSRVRSSIAHPQCQQGESASVESPGRHQSAQQIDRNQQILQQQTPLTRKSKSAQQDRCHTLRQTQLHWDPQLPQHYQPSNRTNQSAQVDQHHVSSVSRQTQPHWDPQLRQQYQPHSSADQWAFSQPPSQIQHSQQRYNANQRYPPSQQDTSGQYRQYGQTRQHHSDQRNSRRLNQQWTSTPRDPSQRSHNFPNMQQSFGDSMMNTSLLNILDKQSQVQQDTTQALSSIIKLQDTRANDAFLSDLHSFNSKPDEFLKWIAAIERVSNVTGRPARELAAAKAEGAVFKCLVDISPSTDWEGCKKILRENFSNIQTRERANSFLMGRCQRPNESLQEYIHVFTELAKITTGLGPRQIAESMMITLFIKHLYNHHIKKQVCKHNHRTLQCAFDSAMRAEADAKKLEGLSDNNVSVMKIETNTQGSNKGVDAKQYPNKQGYNQRQGNQYQNRQFGPCFKCNEHGHVARECLNKQFVRSHNMGYTNQTNLLTSKQPPKVTQTITTEGELSATAWNAVLTQLNEMKMQNLQMKQFVKKHLPTFNKNAKGSPTDRLADSGNQRNTKPAYQQNPNKPTKVNKVDVTLDEIEQELVPPFLLDLLNDSSDEESESQCESYTQDETQYIANVNVVLFSNASMASEFPIGVGSQKDTGLFDSGASHSCISYDCYKVSIPEVPICKAAHINVKNASGESMDPLGVCEATITLGNKKFTHEFIVCENLTSSLVLGLDFSAQFKIGTDWTSDGHMYLYQGKNKLIEGSVNALAAKRPRLVSKVEILDVGDKENLIKNVMQRKRSRESIKLRHQLYKARHKQRLQQQELTKDLQQMEHRHMKTIELDANPPTNFNTGNPSPSGVLLNRKLTSSNENVQVDCTNDNVGCSSFSGTALDKTSSSTTSYQLDAIGDKIQDATIDKLVNQYECSLKAMMHNRDWLYKQRKKWKLQQDPLNKVLMRRNTNQ